MVIPRLDCIGIIVDDMPAALAFYRLLGLIFPEGAETEGHVEAELPGGLRLLFDTVEMIRRFDPEWAPPESGHRMGVGFVCDSPADVDQVFADLMAAGYRGHKEPWDAFWGQRYAQVFDPSGNLVDLFASLVPEDG